ncbi:hypothetical protein E2C01_071343 [Portunus trituberculatus]|uniref:Uncharacterized protein n=1 Tax=Portunus trituberculatus TaxID=210409 RepID=A0A5B7I7R7_PORTR|nr:hypothetical protein [Portunus trituberculatus]
MCVPARLDPRPCRPHIALHLP